METYGFSEDFFTFLHPYLKRRKQSVNVSNVHSMFQSFTIRYPTMVHSGTAALHYFYKCPVLFHKRRTAPKFCQ